MGNLRRYRIRDTRYPSSRDVFRHYVGLAGSLSQILKKRYARGAKAEYEERRHVLQA
jgi:hypothetical protein